MGLISRFAQTYVRPFWFRMAMVMLMAGITSSYSFILGFITKITVDNVLQLRPDVALVDGEGGSPGNNTLGLATSRTRDPQSVLPWKDPFQTQVREKTRAEKIQWLWFIFFLYLVVRSIFAGINWFYNYHIAFVGQRIVFRIRLDLHQKIQKLQMTFFDRQQTGKIMSRVLDDVGLLQSEVTGTFVETARNIARILLGCIILLTINVKLGALTLAAMPFYVITYKLFQKAIQTAFLRQRETYADTYGILEERVRGIRVLLSFAKEKSEYRIFFSRLVKIFRLSLRSSMLSTGLGATCSAISAIATAGIFYLGALEVRNGNMTVGSLIYFNMSMGNLFQPFVALANVNATLQQMVVVISRVFEVLDEEVVISDRPNAVRLDSVKGRVVFRNVSFRYHDAGDEVLKDLSFRLEPGQSLAVVGPSGSGKSTLVNLLLRLYEPTQGRILIDDYDIRDVRISSLRKHISVVPQEPILFSGTIAENIKYGHEDATPAQIMTAASQGELHDFVMTLPEKYEARVGERGSNLSGGQKQRMAFTMALLTDPGILVLDDTTSALDAKTEARIQMTLDRIMANRTTFVITHRISTAQRADQILVLDNGRMAGWGTHKKLVAQPGVYQDLYVQQQAQPESMFLEEEEIV
jgi:subfamily B ATP-binding cassette protein MsbA